MFAPLVVRVRRDFRLGSALLSLRRVLAVVVDGDGVKMTVKATTKRVLLMR